MVILRRRRRVFPSREGGSIEEGNEISKEQRKGRTGEETQRDHEKMRVWKCADCW